LGEGGVSGGRVAGGGDDVVGGEVEGGGGEGERGCGGVEARWWVSWGLGLGIWRRS